MHTIQQQQLEGVSVSIDDTHFVDCTFVDCILEYSGRPISFERTVMRGCRYVFFGSARSTVQFLQGVGLMEGSPLNWGEFPNQVN